MNKADPDFFDLLVESYQRFVGAPPVFLEGGDHSARWLYEDASRQASTLVSAAVTTSTRSIISPIFIRPILSDPALI